MKNNSFLSNSALKNGSGLYILNKNKMAKIVIISNQFEYNKGTAIYLNNPGNITILNSNFLNNIGNIGTCIYYSETFQSFSMRLLYNKFLNNRAFYGGAGLYFENSFYNLDLNKKNTFYGNKAIYGSNYTTFPYRLYLNSKKISGYSKGIIKNVVPGITDFSLDFQFLDYYGQNISINAISSLKIMNKNFLELDEFFIDGKTSSVATNGTQIFFKFFQYKI